MNTKKNLVCAMAALVVIGAFTPSSATPAFWSLNGTGNYTDTANWAVNGNGTGGSPASVPGAGETATFTSSNIVNSTITSNLTADLNVGGFVFSNGGTIGIRSGTGANQTITLGAGGITISSTSATVTFGNTTAGQGIAFTLNGSQTWTNNSTKAFVLNSSNTIGGNGSITKNGTGALTLGAANTYNGSTTLNTGTLSLGSDTALGAAASTLTINGGTIDVTAARTTPNNNAQNWNGNFTFAGTNIWNTGTGAVTMNASRTVTVANTMAVGGNITGAGFALTKAGAGVLTLNGTSNTYDGGTTVSAGTLSLGNTAAKPATGNITVAAGAALALGVGGAGYYSSTDVDSLWANTLAGVTLNATSLVGIDTTAGNFTYSTAQSTRGLVKAGANTLTLNGTYTYTGDTFVRQGTLRLGAGGSLVSSGNLTTSGVGTYDLNGIDQTFGKVVNNGQITNTGPAKTLTIGDGSSSSQGVGSLTGAMDLVWNQGATNSGLGCDVTMTGNITFNANGNGTIGWNIPNGSPFKINNAGTITNNGTGNGTVTLALPIGNSTTTVIQNSATSTLLLTSLNSYGDTIVNAGILRHDNVQNGANTGLGAGNLTMNGGEVQIRNDSSQSYGRNTTVAGNATFTNDSRSGSGVAATQTWGTLNMGNQTLTVRNTANSTSGTSGVKFGATTLTGNSVFTVNSLGNGSATILLTLASLDNGGFTPIFNGTGNSTITGVVSGAGGLAKSGNATLTLSGNNTHTGDTIVNAGTISLNATAALGKSILDTDGAGTLTTNRTTLTMGGLKGSGDLATRITTGYSGVTAITFNSTANVTNTYSGVIANGASGMSITQNGSGTQVLAGNNTYTGATTVNNGTLAIAHGNALGTTANGTSVASGAQLRLVDPSGVTVGNETLSIAGQGVTTGGALRSAAGNNTWGGLITLTDNATIGAASVTSLTIDVASGNAIQAANFNLTFDGAGTNQVKDPLSLGTGSLTKIGSGTTILEANNIYTGNTNVSNGVLSLASGTAIPDTNTLIITGGKVDLSANETVGVLVLGNATQSNSTYGSTSSAAVVKNDTYFSGNRILTVGDGISGITYDSWALSAGLNGTNNNRTQNPDTDKFLNIEEYAFDLDPLAAEFGNILASQTSLSGGNVTLTLAFNGNSSKQDINYVVRRANNPGFTSNTVVGHWNGTNNWTDGNTTYFVNQTQSGAGDVKDINVNMSIPAATEPRQFLKVDIE